MTMVIKNKRVKKHSANETMSLLCANSDNDYLVSIDAQETQAFNGTIAFDATYGNDKYRLPLHLMVFGDFIYDNSEKNLNVVMPKRLACSGDVIITSDSSMSIGRNDILHVTARNIVLDHMGGSHHLRLNHLSASDSIIIKNYSGDQCLYESHAMQKLVFQDCPNITYIDKTTTAIEKIHVHKCPNLVDYVGNINRAYLVINQHNYSDYIDWVGLQSGEKITIDVSDTFTIPSKIKSNSIKINGASLPSILNIELSERSYQSLSDVSITECVSKHDSPSKINVLRTSNDVGVNSLSIFGSAIDEVEISVSKIGTFCAMNSDISKLPESVKEYGELDLRGTSISELPTDITVSKLLIKDTKISYLPNIFNAGKSAHIHADFESLCNAVSYPFIYNGINQHIIMFIDCGVTYVISPIFSCRGVTIHSFEDLLKELNANGEAYSQSLVRFIEPHLLEAKLMLKRKLRSLKVANTITLGQI